MEQFIFKDESKSLDKHGKSILVIDEEEHFHLARVLRLRVGGRILATNGNGKTCLCSVREIGKDKSVCEIIEEYHDLNLSLREYCIGIAMLKPMSKVESALEKCTELGARRFLLFNSERSEKVNPRLERLQGVVKSAVKQSLQSYFPELIVARNLKDAVTQCGNYDEKMVLHEKAVEVVDGHLSLLTKEKSVIALIGPEGGFSEDEIKFLLANGFKSFSLGKARLRSETAAIKIASLLGAY